QIALGEMLTELQSTDISGDGPARARRHLFAIVGHRSVAIGHDIKEVPDRGGAQALNVIRRRLYVAALDDLPVPRAKGIVADHAVDHVPVPSKFEHVAGDRKR